MRNDYFVELIEGSAALMPEDPMQYNEDARVISYEDAARQYHMQMRAPRSYTLKDEIIWKIEDFIDHSQFLYDLRYGTIKGITVSHKMPLWQSLLIGSLYSLLGFASLCYVL